MTVTQSGFPAAAAGSSYPEKDARYHQVLALTAAGGIDKRSVPLADSAVSCVGTYSVAMLSGYRQSLGSFRLTASAVAVRRSSHSSTDSGGLN